MAIRQPCLFFHKLACLCHHAVPVNLFTNTDIQLFEVMVPPTAIIPQADYRIIIEDEEWEYEPPEELGEYDEDAVNATVAQQAVIEAQHRRKYESLLTFCGVSVGAKELIIYAVGEEAVIALKARFIKYAKITPQ